MKKCWVIKWDTEDDILTEYAEKQKVFTDIEKAQEYCAQIINEKNIPTFMGFRVPDMVGRQLFSGSKDYIKAICLEIQE